MATRDGCAGEGRLSAADAARDIANSTRPGTRWWHGTLLTGVGSRRVLTGILNTYVLAPIVEKGRRVPAGSPRRGVRIVSIDGTAAGSLPLTAINEMLEQPVARQLEVRRGEQVIKVTLTPKALI